VTAYHVTTPKKVDRYLATGGILPPVRFWPSLCTAQRWAKRTGRSVILRFEAPHSWPLPDHKPARWTDQMVVDWSEEVGA